MRTTARSANPKSLSKRANVTLTTLAWVLAAVFVYTSFTKFNGSTASVRTFEDIGAGQWLRYVTASLELAGAIGLAIPRLTGLAAACLTALLVGAVLSQLLLVSEPSLATPAALMVITGVLAWVRRDRIAALLPRRSGSRAIVRS